MQTTFRIGPYLAQSIEYLETDEYMVPGVTYALRLKFSYMLSSYLEGFYYSEYVDKEGQHRKIGSFRPGIMNQSKFELGKDPSKMV